MPASRSFCLAALFVFGAIAVFADDAADEGSGTSVVGFVAKGD